MQTNIKGAMTLALKKYLCNINEKLLAKEEKKDKKRKYSREDIATVEQLLRETGWDATKVEKQMKLFSILFDCPELKQGSMIPMENHCVVVLEATVGGHGYALFKPHIITTAKDRWMLASDGRTGAWAFIQADKPRLATIQEVNECVDSLSEKQWASLMNPNETLLKPLMDCMMGSSVEAQDHEQSTEGDEEGVIELANGRSITVSNDN